MDTVKFCIDVYAKIYFYSHCHHYTTLPSHLYHYLIIIYIFTLVRNCIVSFKDISYFTRLLSSHLCNNVMVLYWLNLSCIDNCDVTSLNLQAQSCYVWLFNDIFFICLHKISTETEGQAAVLIGYCWGAYDKIHFSPHYHDFPTLSSHQYNTYFLVHNCIISSRYQ